MVLVRMNNISMLSVGKNFLMVTNFKIIYLGSGAEGAHSNYVSEVEADRYIFFSVTEFFFSYLNT